MHIAHKVNEIPQRKVFLLPTKVSVTLESPKVRELNLPLKVPHISRRIDDAHQYIPLLVHPPMLSKQTMISWPIVDAVQVMKWTCVGVTDAVCPGGDRREVALCGGWENCTEGGPGGWSEEDLGYRGDTVR